MSDSFETPLGQYPPLIIVTTNDHTAWIVISTALGIPIILIFGAIRVFVRRTVGIGLDDVLLALATLLAIIQSSLVLSACSYGLGRTVLDVPADALVTVQQRYYASNILFLVALALSKGSVAALLLRLVTADDQRRIFFKALLVFVGVWLVVSIFCVSLQCDLSHPWALVDEQCPRSFLRWQVIGALDIMYEVAVVAMSTMLVWGLHTQMTTKVHVVLGFSFRLLLIMVIAFRLATFPRFLLTIDPTLRLDLFIVWTQTELNWSIISATIPSLQPFLRGLSTYTGTLFESGVHHASGSNKQDTAYMLSDLGYLHSKDRKRRSAHERSQTGAAFDTINNGIRGSAFVQTQLPGQRGPERDGTSVGSNDSQHMIIRKEVTWTVDQESTLTGD